MGGKVATFSKVMLGEGEMVGHRPPSPVFSAGASHEHREQLCFKGTFGGSRAENILVNTLVI